MVALNVSAPTPPDDDPSLQSEAGQPPRPASALAAAMEFNVDSLFADTQSAPQQGPLSQRAESTDGVQEGNSRFGRWFQLENSPSTAKSLPPQLEQPGAVSRPQSAQTPANFFQDNQAAGPGQEPSQIQVVLRCSEFALKPWLPS